jgi:7,8-dihydropterin-6-yl-methyl-4-(beta-D-ribofuranosyl)aminobenzene 5'-phosphate synthase
MEVKITTLSENTAKFGYLAEWGLSMLVEADSVKILMDTGLSFSAVHNAQLMGIDLATIDRIVLSHGHVDHTGGLREILKIKGEVEVIAHPDIWTAKYSKRNEEGTKHIGIPFTREELESLGARFNLTREAVHIDDMILITGEIPMVSGYEKIENNLFVKNRGELKPDPLADDLALIINADFGLVVILGCAHRGIINTLRHSQNLTGDKNVYAVVGGTHLFPASRERVDRTIADLRELGIQQLGVSHCTGFHAEARLAQEFGDAFVLNNTGTKLKYGHGPYFTVAG